ncbi:MAG: SDR family oxidoreductase [Candidatus Parvarchaeota archaeon]
MIKKVLITGSSGGIGSAVVEKFAGNGWEVIGIDIKEGKFPSKYNVKEYYVDLLDIQALGEIRNELLNTPLDAIVNCVGKYFAGTIDDTTQEKAIEIINLNFMTIFNSIKTFVGLVKNGGSIVNISSVNSWFPQKNSVIYNSMKGAVISFTKSLARDLAKRQIRVNSISPGSVLTPPLDNYITQLSKQNGISEESIKERIGKLYLLDRIAEPAEIANVAYFLSSSESSFITGANVTVDGGLTIKSET